jgi:hypothetical protein
MMKKPRPFDEALGAIEERLNFFELGLAEDAAYILSKPIARQVIAELRAAIRVLRAAGQYTAYDDGTAWNRLIRAIIAARKIAERKEKP